MRRVLPGLLAVAALYADGHGSHGVAFYAILGAIPLAAVAGLDAFGAFLDDHRELLPGLQAALWGLAVALLVLSSAARSSVGETHPAPALGASALAAAVGVLVLKACLAVVPYVRRSPIVRPAKP
jgi:hypothetical protein